MSTLTMRAEDMVASDTQDVALTGEMDQPPTAEAATQEHSLTQSQLSSTSPPSQSPSPQPSKMRGTVKKRKPEEECRELKNIRYKSLMLHGTPLQETRASTCLENVEHILEAETIHKSSEPWCKLNKTMKLRKLLEYVPVFRESTPLSEEDAANLALFFQDCLNKKKLTKVKDVVYDREKGCIVDIPSLAFGVAKRHFTLKNLDKRTSTLKSLPSSSRMDSATAASASSTNIHTTLNTNTK